MSLFCLKELLVHNVGNSSGMDVFDVQHCRHGLSPSSRRTLVGLAAAVCP